VNLAEITCTASSDYSAQFSCEKAFDNDEGSDWASRGEGVGAWIQATFPRPVKIAKLKILQRRNPSEANKQISLTTSSGWSHTAMLLEKGDTQWNIITLPEPVTTNWVKITVNDVYGTINNGFKEIKIYEEQQEGGQLDPVGASQSSTYSNNYDAFGAANCIDGETGADSGPRGLRLCHTNSERFPWLAIDFGSQSVNVQRVEIFNRLGCCGDRTRGVHVIITEKLPIMSDSGWQITGSVLGTTFNGPAANGQRITISGNPGQEISGRYVIVRMSNGGTPRHLNLKEVRAFGRLASTGGVLTSPNHPGNYPNSIDKTETLQVLEGRVMSLEFSAFYIEYDSWCRHDHLTIVDGDGTTLMEQSCGNMNQDGHVVIGDKHGSSLPVIRSRSNIVKFHFKTDHSVQRSGWSVKWAQVDDECAELENMHHAFALARVAFYCSVEPSTGRETECEKRLLHKIFDLRSCPSASIKHCFFQLIAEEPACINKPEEICHAIDRITNHLIAQRQTHCNGPDLRSGCSFIRVLSCSASIWGMRAACLAANAEDGEALLAPCLAFVATTLGDCEECIDEVLPAKPTKPSQSQIDGFPYWNRRINPQK